MKTEGNHDSGKENDRSKHARKRTAAQKAADAVFVEAHAIRGKTQIEIAELLAAERPYRISRSQVQFDLERIKHRWLASANDAFASARAKAIRTLDELERVAWTLVDAPDDASGQGIARVLAVYDRRARLLGLDAPVRNEVNGTVQVATPPCPMSEAERREILKRTYERTFGIPHDPPEKSTDDWHGDTESCGADRP